MGVCRMERTAGGGVCRIRASCADALYAHPERVDGTKGPEEVFSKSTSPASLSPPPALPLSTAGASLPCPCPVSERQLS